MIISLAWVVALDTIARTLALPVSKQDFLLNLRPLFAGGLPTSKLAKLNKLTELRRHPRAGIRHNLSGKASESEQKPAPLKF